MPDGKQRTFLFLAKGRYERLAGGRVMSDEPLPKEFAFDQNYPNPFNPSTTFEFALPEPGHVTLEVYNILGQSVTALVDQAYVAGRHRYHWDGTVRGRPLASGVYFAKLVAGEHLSIRKMVVVK